MRLFRALCAMVTLVIPSVLLADVRYILTNLGTLGGTDSQAWGLNNEGQVVGDSTPYGGGGSRVSLQRLDHA